MTRSGPPARVCLLCLLCLLWGCTSAPPITTPPVQKLPTYADLIARYNQNLAGVDRLWSRAVVEIEWHDDDGRHFEQGEGNLIALLPDRLALSVGKLGNAILWAGCDANQYWYFDLREGPTLYVGTHDAATGRAAATAQVASPMPIRPSDLVLLLGLSTLNPNALPPEPRVELYNGHFLIEPPDRPVRILIDPATSRPVRIDLLDPTGRSAVIATLSRPERMTVQGRHPGAYPTIPTRYEISLVDGDGRITLFLADASDGRAGARIKDGVFDLTRLQEIFKPARFVPLDEPAQ